MRAIFMRLWIAFLLACAMVFSGPALAQTASAAPKQPPVTAPQAAPSAVTSTPGGPVFPALTGRVVDGANIIPADLEASLTQRLAALEAKSSDQVVVVTVPSLQGYEIEEYGYRLGRTWQIGQGERLNNGVILLVAPNERKVRVEVGYGLEGVLTDYESGRIIRDNIVPAFKAGDMPGGIVAGVDGIEAILTLDPAELQARAERGLREPEYELEKGDPITTLFVILIIIFWIWLAFSKGPSGRLTRSSGWSRGAANVRDWRTTNAAVDVAGDVLGGIISIALSGDGDGGGGGGGGFSGGGGSFGGGGSSGSW